MRPSLSAQERQWRAQQDLRTLAEAEEIRRNTQRASAVKAEARKQMSALSKVARKK